MARELTESLEVVDENNTYRETFYLLKAEIARIRREYFLGAESIGKMAVDEIDSELETLTLTIENVLF
jgi:hypothetical protein